MSAIYFFLATACALTLNPLGYYDYNLTLDESPLLINIPSNSKMGVFFHNKKGFKVDVYSFGNLIGSANPNNGPVFLDFTDYSSAHVLNVTKNSADSTVDLFVSFATFTTDCVYRVITTNTVDSFSIGNGSHNNLSIELGINSYDRYCIWRPTPNYGSHKFIKDTNVASNMALSRKSTPGFASSAISNVITNDHCSKISGQSVFYILTVSLTAGYQMNLTFVQEMESRVSIDVYDNFSKIFDQKQSLIVSGSDYLEFSITTFGDFDLNLSNYSMAIIKCPISNTMVLFHNSEGFIASSGELESSPSDGIVAYHFKYSGNTIVVNKTTSQLLLKVSAVVYSGSCDTVTIVTDPTKTIQIDPSSTYYSLNNLYSVCIWYPMIHKVSFDVSLAFSSSYSLKYISSIKNNPRINQTFLLDNGVFSKNESFFAMFSTSLEYCSEYSVKITPTILQNVLGSFNDTMSIVFEPLIYPMLIGKECYIELRTTEFITLPLSGVQKIRFDVFDYDLSIVFHETTGFYLNNGNLSGILSPFVKPIAIDIGNSTSSLPFKFYLYKNTTDYKFKIHIASACYNELSGPICKKKYINTNISRPFIISDINGSIPSYNDTTICYMFTSPHPVTTKTFASSDNFGYSFDSYAGSLNGMNGYHEFSSELLYIYKWTRDSSIDISQIYVLTNHTANSIVEGHFVEYSASIVPSLTYQVFLNNSLVQSNNSIFNNLNISYSISNTVHTQTMMIDMLNISVYTFSFSSLRGAFLIHNTNGFECAIFDNSNNVLGYLNSTNNNYGFITESKSGKLIVYRKKYDLVLSISFFVFGADQCETLIINTNTSESFSIGNSQDNSIDNRICIWAPTPHFVDTHLEANIGSNDELIVIPQYPSTSYTIKASLVNSSNITKSVAYIWKPAVAQNSIQISIKRDLFESRTGTYIENINQLYFLTGNSGLQVLSPSYLPQVYARGFNEYSVNMNNMGSIRINCVYERTILVIHNKVGYTSSAYYSNGTKISSSSSFRMIDLGDEANGYIIVNKSITGDYKLRFSSLSVSRLSYPCNKMIISTNPDSYMLFDKNNGNYTISNSDSGNYCYYLATPHKVAIYPKSSVGSNAAYLYLNSYVPSDTISSTTITATNSQSNLLVLRKTSPYPIVYLFQHSTYIEKMYGSYEENFYIQYDQTTNPVVFDNSNIVYPSGISIPFTYTTQIINSDIEVSDSINDYTVRRFTVSPNIIIAFHRLEGVEVGVTINSVFQGIINRTSKSLVVDFGGDSGFIDIYNTVNYSLGYFSFSSLLLTDSCTKRIVSTKANETILIEQNKGNISQINASVCVWISSPVDTTFTVLVSSEHCFDNVIVRNIFPTLTTYTINGNNQMKSFKSRSSLFYWNPDNSFDSDYLSITSRTINQQTDGLTTPQSYIYESERGILSNNSPILASSLSSVTSHYVVSGFAFESIDISSLSEYIIQCPTPSSIIIFHNQGGFYADAYYSNGTLIDRINPSQNSFSFDFGTDTGKIVVKKDGVNQLKITFTCIILSTYDTNSKCNKRVISTSPTEKYYIQPTKGNVSLHRGDYICVLFSSASKTKISSYGSGISIKRNLLSLSTYSVTSDTSIIYNENDVNSALFIIQATSDLSNLYFQFQSYPLEEPNVSWNNNFRVEYQQPNNKALVGQTKNFDLHAFNAKSSFSISIPYNGSFLLSSNVVYESTISSDASYNRVIVFHTKDGYYGEVMDSALSYYYPIQPKNGLNTIVIPKSKSIIIRLIKEHPINTLEVVYSSIKLRTSCTELQTITDPSKSFEIKNIEGSINLRSLCVWYTSPHSVLFNISAIIDSDDTFAYYAFRNTSLNTFPTQTTNVKDFAIENSLMFHIKTSYKSKSEYVKLSPSLFETKPGSYVDSYSAYTNITSEIIVVDSRRPKNLIINISRHGFHSINMNYVDTLEILSQIPDTSFLFYNKANFTADVYDQNGNKIETLNPTEGMVFVGFGDNIGKIIISKKNTNEFTIGFSTVTYYGMVNGAQTIKTRIITSKNYTIGKGKMIDSSPGTRISFWVPSLVNRYIDCEIMDGFYNSDYMFLYSVATRPGYTTVSSTFTGSDRRDTLTIASPRSAFVTWSMSDLNSNAYGSFNLSYINDETMIEFQKIYYMEYDIKYTNNGKIITSKTLPPNDESKTSAWVYVASGAGTLAVGSGIASYFLYFRKPGISVEGLNDNPDPEVK